MAIVQQEENYEREKHEDRERWEEYQRTGKAISDDTATAWLSDLAQGKVAPCPK